MIPAHSIERFCLGIHFRYPSRIIKVNVEKKEVLVHFDKWSARFDVWLHKDSPKLRMIKTRGNKVKEKVSGFKLS